MATTDVTSKDHERYARARARGQRKNVTVEPVAAFSIADHKYGTIEFMRTTVDIPDAVYRRLKTRAASEGSSAKALILRGVEQLLQVRRRPSRGRVALPLVRSKRPGTVPLDNARIYDIIAFP